MASHILWVWQSPTHSSNARTDISSARRVSLGEKVLRPAHHIGRCCPQATIMEFHTHTHMACFQSGLLNRPSLCRHTHQPGGYELVNVSHWETWLTQDLWAMCLVYGLERAQDPPPTGLSRLFLPGLSRHFLQVVYVSGGQSLLQRRLSEMPDHRWSRISGGRKTSYFRDPSLQHRGRWLVRQGHGEAGPGRVVVLGMVLPRVLFLFWMPQAGWVLSNPLE